MDDRHFDRLVRSLSRLTTRRSVLSASGAAAIGGLGLAAAGDAAAGGRQGKSKQKKRCKSAYTNCAKNGPRKQCCSRLCCPPLEFWEEEHYSCAPNDGLATCCTVEQGGGFCEGANSLCCGVPLRNRETICELAGGECCLDEFGGSCGPGFACCADVSLGYCCPNVAATLRSTGRLAPNRQPRNFRRRNGS